MATYTLSVLVQPQYVAAGSAAALPLVPAGASVVPAGQQFQIQTCRVSNVSGSPVTLEVWRVPSGQSTANTNLVQPTISIPVASQTFAQFDVAALFGATLQPGDAIWMLAGTASALVVQADGLVILN